MWLTAVSSSGRFGSASGGPVPGVLWLPPPVLTAPAGLLGHGGAGMRTARIVSLACWFASGSAWRPWRSTGLTTATGLRRRSRLGIIRRASLPRESTSSWTGGQRLAGCRRGSGDPGRRGYRPARVPGSVHGDRYGLPFAAAMGSQLRCVVSASSVSSRARPAPWPGRTRPRRRDARRVTAPALFHRMGRRIFPRTASWPCSTSWVHQTRTDAQRHAVTSQGHRRWRTSQVTWPPPVNTRPARAPSAAVSRQAPRASLAEEPVAAVAVATARA